MSLDFTKVFDIPSYLCNCILDFLGKLLIGEVLEGYSSEHLATDYGVPKDLHINDMLILGVFAYGDDSTVVNR